MYPWSCFARPGTRRAVRTSMTSAKYTQRRTPKCPRNTFGAIGRARHGCACCPSCCLSPNGIADSYHAIPFFPAASDPLGRQGFARVVNLSDSAGTVSIVAFDDGGRRHGPVTLSLDARQTRHFNSGDLEDGAASKGLPQGTGGPTSGDWRLELSSELNINVLSYIRTSDGFVTSMHDVAASDGETLHVPFFNPGSNYRQESLLRLVNPGDAAVQVIVQAVDDLGAGGAVDLRLEPYAARTISAVDLEDGASGLNGSLGDGAGKWRLAISADGAIMAMSLLSTPTGHLTNLSTDPGWVLSDSGGVVPPPPPPPPPPSDSNSLSVSGSGVRSDSDGYYVTSTCPPDSSWDDDIGENGKLIVDYFHITTPVPDGDDLLDSAYGWLIDVSASVLNCGKEESDPPGYLNFQSSNNSDRSFGSTPIAEARLGSLPAGASSGVKTVRNEEVGFADFGLGESAYVYACAQNRCTNSFVISR